MLNETESSARQEADRQGSLSLSALTQALALAKEREAELLEEANRRKLEAAAAGEEARLLERLLAIRRGEAPELSQELEPKPDGKVLPHPRSRKLQPLVVSVLALLQEAGRPLHISELMRQLNEREVPIPGAGRQANVIAVIRKDARIVRPSRGMYGLATWDLKPVSVKKRRRRRRKPTRPVPTSKGQQ